MIFLADFSVIRPEPGLFFWAVAIFIVFWLLVAKFAFKPIGKALKEREKSIQDSLDQAQLAQEKMERLKSENDQLLKEAMVERAKLVSEAREIQTNMINEAKMQASAEASKIVEKAKSDIQNEKAAAFEDLKNKISSIALVIAEKVLEKNLSSDKAQTEYAEHLLDKMNVN